MSRLTRLALAICPPLKVDERVRMFLDKQIMVESLLNEWCTELFDASDRPGWYAVRVRAWDRGEDSDPVGMLGDEKWRLDFTYEGGSADCKPIG